MTGIAARDRPVGEQDRRLPSPATWMEPGTVASLASSPSTRRARGAPTSRTPMRSACSVSRYAASKSAPRAASVNQSARGPGRSARVTGRRAAGTRPPGRCSGTDAPGSAPIASARPGATGSGPSPASVSREREPSGAVVDAAAHRQHVADAPLGGAELEHRAGAGAGGGVRRERRPSRVDAPHAPVTANQVSPPSNLARNPPTRSRPRRCRRDCRPAGSRASRRRDRAHPRRHAEVREPRSSEILDEGERAGLLDDERGTSADRLESHPSPRHEQRRRVGLAIPQRAHRCGR